ncbi:hypothetical protein TRFO_34451 [Tritrichomonas foetus]|uniref:Uncharacterized protein n=1 Tax=Tritrichomonas foetus TaxID=1144522 RepID=A0A1J4JJ06_9EUKA|nr:hypothetical protein TRFO_34451 [Tritrichomonas foetus]|eukprot:OHS99168.1 hypothetical protein TRFO_34451 [Tritrichomonas foetus]
MTEVQQIHKLNFTSTIQNVVKVDDTTIAICLGIDLFICSPFTQNRPLGGMHNKNFKNTHPIMGACSMPISSELTMKFFKSDYRHPYKIQNGLVIFDTGSNFTVIDSPRNLVITKFAFHTSDVIDICASPNTPCQLAILTSTELIIIKIDLNQYIILKKIPVEGRAISPYLDGFLIDTHHNLKYLNGTQLKSFAPHAPFADFRIDNDRVIVAYPSNNAVKFRVVGGEAFRLHNIGTLIWDTAGGFVFVLHDGIHLSIVSIDDVSRNCLVTLSEKLNKTLEMFAQVDRLKKNIIVIVFSENSATTISVPLTLFSESI